MRLLAPFALACLLALPVSAMVLDTANPGNTSPPADDPGWDYVGRTNFNAVYLGNGWVVGPEHTVDDTDESLDLRFQSFNQCVYPGIPGSKVTLQNPPEGPTGTPDLAVWRIELEGENPFAPECPTLDLPVLPLRSEPIAPGEPVTFVTEGTNQGALQTVCFPNVAGYPYVSGRAKRWGANQVHESGVDLNVGGLVSRLFSTRFDSGVSPDEAQVGNGDSGGGVFAQSSQGDWELAGVLVSRVACNVGAAAYGDLTYAVEIAHYRDPIHDLARDCDDGEDDDGDGLVDLDDPACHGPDTFAEVSDCADGFDNDSDGLADLDDPGCRGGKDHHIEDPQCSDGIDNDGDTFVDYPADPECLDPGDPTEQPTSSGSGGCGLLGIEAVLLVAWLRRLRRSLQP